MVAPLFRGNGTSMVYRSTQANLAGCSQLADPLAAPEADRLLQKQPRGAWGWHMIPGQNDIARSLCERHGVPFLEVHHATKQRPGGHKAGCPSCNARGKDCVHYCLPGPPDEWTRLLLSYWTAGDYPYGTFTSRHWNAARAPRYPLAPAAPRPRTTSAVLPIPPAAAVGLAPAGISGASAAAAGAYAVIQPLPTPRRALPLSTDRSKAKGERPWDPLERPQQESGVGLLALASAMLLLQAGMVVVCCCINQLLRKEVEDERERARSPVATPRRNPKGARTGR